MWQSIKKLTLFAMDFVINYIVYIVSVLLCVLICQGRCPKIFFWISPQNNCSLKTCLYNLTYPSMNAPWSHAGTTLWNVLPSAVWNDKTMDTFKEVLKRHLIKWLLRKYFNITYSCIFLPTFMDFLYTHINLLFSSPSKYFIYLTRTINYAVIYFITDAAELS